MFKTIQIIVMATLCLNFNSRAQSQSILPLPNKQAILGKVISSTTNESIPGAVIKVTAPKLSTVSNDKGEFILTLSNGTYNISISHLGYKSKSISIPIPLKEPLIIALDTEDKNLQEIEIVSTGYQNIPKERATGSFTTIGEKTLNRNVGINIVDRLEGVASGLLLNRGMGISNTPKISIHGRSTIFANAEPLIVLDGFPYDGTIDQINPADIETIHLLKDATASSIWGTRSGNGVVVIITKSGRKNQKLAINVSSTFTITGKPNLYLVDQLSSSDFIGLEEFLFSKGFYNSRFSNPYNSVSAAVEIFNQRKNNTISSLDSAAQIDRLKDFDVRRDLNKYVYRNQSQQQYQLNLRGGTENHTYYISAGYDKNLADKVTEDFDRLSINAKNTFSLLKNRWHISGDISYTASNTNSNPSLYSPKSPYDRIADENGRSVPVVLNSSTAFRMSYMDTVGNGKLLDWHYFPKDELSSYLSNRVDQLRIKVGNNIRIINGLDLSVNYQYLKESSIQKLDRDTNWYYTRNMINQYSTIIGNTVNRVIPVGNINREVHRDFVSKVFRAQLNLNKTIIKDHEINVIAGYEGGDARATSNGQTYYGYDPINLTHANSTIDPLFLYDYYYSSASGTIPTAPDLLGTISINQSYYSNTSYTYKNRYILSGSIRRDESNLFGVKTNQKGVPLWSTGISWIISEEKFFSQDWFPMLKLRATYGYNGNVDKSVSAYLTASTTSTNNIMGNPYAVIQNPPNPSLRWEKVRIWNLGIDFSFKNTRITGSIDAYEKNAVDLISNNPIAMQTGIIQFRGNGANLQTKGIDAVINTTNLTGKLQWFSKLLFSYNTDKVTSYKVKQVSNSQIASNNEQNPLEGYSYYGIFSFPFAGLDNKGAAQGYLNGALSKDYTAITGTLDPTQLKYHGSASPKYFGSLINTFAYSNFQLSFNITYKLGYYFRRNGVFSGSNFGSAALTSYSMLDYAKRWQKPGDELTTNIPALTYPASRQDGFFQNSDVMVESGNHIRLQDIRLSFSLGGSRTQTSFFRNANIFVYAKNLGILWRENNLKIDPDYGATNIPQSFSGSLGINITL
jgi:TonB-linked SusC/RagA family outer membrane protein